MIKRISVIIPVYNVEKYLKRCIDSILNNIYSNLEIILVNDGSLDNCPNICDEYLLKDKRIKVIHKENGGLSSARNTGLDVATGDFVAFIDSDDWISQDYFSILMNVQSTEDYDVVICDYISTSQENYRFDTESSFDVKELTRQDVLTKRVTKTHVWGRIYKRQIIDNIRFENEKLVLEDALYNATVIQRNNELKIAYVDTKIYAYYKREGSLVQSIPTHTIVELANRIFQLSMLEEDVKLKNMLVEDCIKRYLAARYTYEVQKEKNDINKLLKKSYKYLKSKKLLYYLFIKYPIVYRSYRILQDPTLLNWEKEHKK